MVILVILAVIAASSILYVNKSKHTSEIIDDIAAGAFVLSSAALFVLVLISTFTKSDYCETNEYNKLNEQYKAIISVCNSDKKNIVLLANDIAEYNSKILNGRMAMDSIWFSLYNCECYYDLPLIEFDIKSENTESEELS